MVKKEATRNIKKSLNYMRLLKQEVNAVGCVESHALRKIHSTESLYYETKKDKSLKNGTRVTGKETEIKEYQRQK